MIYHDPQQVRTHYLHMVAVERAVLFICMSLWLFCLPPDRSYYAHRWLAVAVFLDFLVYLSIGISCVWIFHFRIVRGQPYSSLSSRPTEVPQTTVHCRHSGMRFIEQQYRALAVLAVSIMTIWTMAGIAICLYEYHTSGVELFFALVEMFTIIFGVFWYH